MANNDFYEYLKKKLSNEYHKDIETSDIIAYLDKYLTEVEMRILKLEEGVKELEKRLHDG